MVLLGCPLYAGEFGGKGNSGAATVASSDFKVATPYTCDSTATADSIWISAHDEGNGDDTLLLFIYRDSGDFGGTDSVPASLVVFSDTILITSDSPTFADVSVPVSASLTAGTVYWLGFINIGTTQVTVNAKDTTFTITDFNADDHTPDDPFGTASGLNDDKLAVWVKYTTPVASATTKIIGKALLGKGII